LISATADEQLNIVGKLAGRLFQNGWLIDLPWYFRPGRFRGPLNLKRATPLGHPELEFLGFLRLEKK